MVNFWEMAQNLQVFYNLNNFKFNYSFLSLWIIFEKRHITMTPFKIKNCILGHNFLAIFYVFEIKSIFLKKQKKIDPVY